MRRQLTKAPYGKLVLKQLIGKGSYGQIFKAYAQAQNKQYAVKLICPETDSDSLVNIERQIKILMSCNHPNIVKCYGVQIIDDMVWIVMEYYSNGSLADIMARQKRTFTETQIQMFLTNIVSALVYLHGKSIIHRDIKAANILIDDNGDIKVADFGVSTLVSHSHKHTRTGSPLWMSPELLSNSNYSFKTDIWSLGITALQLAEGVPPYSHQHPYRAIFSIQAHPPDSLSEPHKWSSQFNNFVSKCLTIDQNKRPSAIELQKHKFLLKSQQTDNIAKVHFVNSICGKLSMSQLQKNVNCGTVIFHEEFNPSHWQKNESQQKQNQYSGTFQIRQEKLAGKNFSPTLLAKITRALPLNLNSIQNFQIQQQKQQSVQMLYLEMEEQIKNIRKKYLSKIRSIQEKEMLTFSSQLKRNRQKSFVLNKLYEN